MKKYYWMVRILGVLHFLLAIYHVQYWWMLDWPGSLEGLTEANRAATQVLNVGVIMILLTVALLCLRDTGEMITTRLGFNVLWMLGVFYILRIVGEFYFADSLSYKSLGVAAGLLPITVLYFIAAHGNSQFRKQMKRFEGMQDMRR